MSTYSLHRKQLIPASVEEIWKFFSSPLNLRELTPKHLNFKVLTKGPLADLHEGQVIEYYVHPILRIPLYWRTEITAVDFQKRFVDEQRKGPYKLWRHEHVFTPVDGGVLMEDHVTYRLPLGFIGNIAHALLVKRMVHEIFDYRAKRIAELFPPSS